MPAGPPPAMQHEVLRVVVMGGFRLSVSVGVACRNLLTLDRRLILL
jgi:hypothetical protein